MRGIDWLVLLESYKFLICFPGMAGSEDERFKVSSCTDVRKGLGLFTSREFPSGELIFR